MITTLEWDSNFFKQQIGMVKLEVMFPGQILQLEKEKKSKGFDLVYVSINKVTTDNAKELAEVGAMFVDEKVTYAKCLVRPGNNHIYIERFEGDVTQKLIELALASGHKSRFNRDPRTAPYFADMYRTWIENSVNKSAADEVLVSKYNNEISGFVTVKKNGHMGSIGLIAVDEKMRGMGIGKELLVAADNWYLSNNCRDASVVTQKDNQQACTLYEKTGYIVENTQFIFHL